MRLAFNFVMCADMERNIRNDQDADGGVEGTLDAFRNLWLHDLQHGQQVTTVASLAPVASQAPASVPDPQPPVEPSELIATPQQDRVPRTPLEWYQYAIHRESAGHLDDGTLFTN